jgi:hypothetical protein
MVEPIRKALFPGVLVAVPVKVMASAPASAVVEQSTVFISTARADEPLSPIEFLVKLFAPLILRAEDPPPVPEPVSEPAAEVQDDPPAGESCSVGGGFNENVRRWCDLITRTASDHGLDPNLIAAVMTVESAGNPDAYSRSGAVGLMQVMPRDGIAASFNCVNGPCFAKRPSMAELYDPEFNLAYAGGMLAGLINRHGSWRDALFAYGPTGTGYAYADKVLGVYERNR